MNRASALWTVGALVVCVLLVGVSAGGWVVTHDGGDFAVWLFNNETGDEVNILYLEFDQEVTLDGFMVFGGLMIPLGPITSNKFDLVGELVDYGTVQIYLPLGAVPTLAQWLALDAAGNPVPTGTPYFTSVAVLGRLFGQGIVAAREANPEALIAAFNEFFETNAEFMAEASQSLGMSLVDSLMPIIMASPAEGIENFFNTIMGMLGVTELAEVTEGDVDFSALFALLGM